MGTRYMLENAQVVTLGIGRKGKLNTARYSLFFGVIAIASSNIGYLFDEEYFKFVFGVSFDALVTAVSAAFTSVISAAITTSTAVTAVFLSELIAALVVGYAVTSLVVYLDEKYNMKKKMREGIQQKLLELDHDVEATWTFVNSLSGLQWMMTQLEHM